MLQVELWEKIIEREERPNNSDIDGRIKSIKKKFIGAYNTKYPVSVGDLIRIGDEQNSDIWYISALIHQLYRVDNEVVANVSDEDVEYIICEVEKVTGDWTFSYGKKSWKEHIPEVCDVEEIIK